VSWQSKRSLVHQIPQERQPAHLEARAITAVCPAKDYNRWNNKAQTLKKACFRGYPKSTICVQVPVGSRNPAIHNAYRTSLRPSSLFEPRHPSLKVVSSSGSRHERRNVFKYRSAIAFLRKRIAAGTKQGILQEHPCLAPLPARACTRVAQGHPHTDTHRRIHMELFGTCANDPSAGSPTETLLRLLLPLSDKVH
jgi:hypothetical protein